MNNIEIKLKELNTDLFARLQETRVQIELLLQQYSKNFPTYTDHSLKHTLDVYKLVSEVLNEEEINNLNDQELYCLSMASLLHDVGMCLPDDRIKEFESDKRFTHYKEKNPMLTTEDLIRDLHHELSYDFIMKEFELLKIPNEEYAKAIALISKGHRKVELNNVDEYKAKFQVESGRKFVCLPYLSAILRLSDELDITNTRTPELLLKYYTPENEKSKLEWEKHQSTYMVNMDEDTIFIKAKSDDQNVYNALKTQFGKINEVLEYCQKVIRNIGNTGLKTYSLALTKLEYNIRTNLDFKNIKFSVDVANVITTLMGDKLYDSKLVPIRELVQNALDSCMYKQSFTEDYEPKITITLLDDKIICEDNGVGMDEYIVEKYFAKLSSSYYKTEKLKSEYESIGRFGIGVFSYFLIADYIEVETKKENALPLKFRADKNPQNYFYFFNDVHKETCGTKIVLEYKKEIELLNINNIKNYITKIFEFVKIPLSVVIADEDFNIGKEIEAINMENYVTQNILSIYRKEFLDTEKVNHSFKNDFMEGIITFLPSSPFTNFQRDDISLSHLEAREKSFRIFNKGIFVESISSVLLQKCIGNINILTNIDLNVSRNTFQSKRIKEYIFNEEIKILSKFGVDFMPKANKLQKWIYFSNNYLLFDFLHNIYLNKTYYSNLILNNFENKSFFLQNIALKCIRNKVEDFITIPEIIENESFFVLEAVDEENLDSLNLGNDLIIKHLFFQNYLLDLLIKDNYKKYLYLANGFAFIARSKAISTNIYLLNDFFDKKYTSINENKALLIYVGNYFNGYEFDFDSSIDYVLNNCHPIVNFLIEKATNDNSKSHDYLTVSSLISSIAVLLTSFNSYDDLDLGLIEQGIIQLYKKTNALYDTKFEFDRSHLPIELVSYIEKK